MSNKTCAEAIVSEGTTHTVSRRKFLTIGAAGLGEITAGGAMMKKTPGNSLPLPQVITSLPIVKAKVWAEGIKPSSGLDAGRSIDSTE